MAPQVTHFNDLSYVSEVFGSSTHDFLYTEFFLVEEDDAVYYGNLAMPKLKISLEQFTSALQRVPDKELYPELRSNANYTLAPDALCNDTHYIKRPHIKVYNDYKEQDAVSLLPLMLLDEAQALELVSQHPHPNIVKYYGCRVRRGRITALILDRHPHNLREYLKDGAGAINNKEVFMAALESAVRHLHSLGLAHNDINPANVLVSSAGTPVLIDFGSCREIGRKLGGSRGTPGWIQGESMDYDTSEEGHDWFALEKMRAWLDEQIHDG